MKNTKTRLAGLLMGLAIFLTAPAWADSSYSFPRVVEGSATVIGAEGDRDNLEANMPILVGDRLWVPYESRLELVLSDRGLLRVGGDSQLDFRAVAYSADTDDRSTEIHLTEGKIQFIVPRDVLGDSLPVLVTPEATIYIDEPGTFRLTVSRDGWTELVVRDGRAEMTADRESSLVRAGDMAVIEGGRRPYFDIRRASYRDNLERWGEELTREASYSSVPYVDESLSYVAAPLANNGAWVSIGGRHGWRPRVSVGWRPYSHGYWRTTPAGLTWVSRDSWGYLTHHYGSWDNLPGHGWVWYPGTTYSRARVHWYWGNDYVGWCPSGYYASYHGSRYGSRRGIFGWAGGSWDRFSNWNFTASIHFGRREQHRHVRSGRDMHHRGNMPRLERGIITTDPGIISRGQRPRDVMTRLEGDIDSHRRTTGRDLPDVSTYIGRQPLTSDLRDAISKPKPLSRPSKPAVRVERFPGSSSAKPGVRKPRVIAKPIDKPSRLGKPTDKPTRLGKPSRIDRIPSTRPGRVETTRPRPTIKPRTERPKPNTPRVERYEAPRVTKPRATPPRTTRPGITKPRTTTPRTDTRVTPRKPTRVERYEAPRVTKPRATKPRATAPRTTTPRTTTPRVTPRKPTRVERYEAPRVTKPRATAPRTERPKAPAPRVTKPSSSKPKPSVERSRSSKEKKPKVKPRRKKKDN